MYKVLLGGYTSRYRIETRTFATNEIVDKGRGSAVSLSHENYINLRLANEGTGPKLCQTLCQRTKAQINIVLFYGRSESEY